MHKFVMIQDEDTLETDVPLAIKTEVLFLKNQKESVGPLSELGDHKAHFNSAR